MYCFQFVCEPLLFGIKDIFRITLLKWLNRIKLKGFSCNETDIWSFIKLARESLSLYIYNHTSGLISTKSIVDVSLFLISQLEVEPFSSFRF